MVGQNPFKIMICLCISFFASHQRSKQQQKNTRKQKETHLGFAIFLRKTLSDAEHQLSIKNKFVFATFPSLLKAVPR